MTFVLLCVYLLLTLLRPQDFLFGGEYFDLQVILITLVFTLTSFIFDKKQKIISVPIITLLIMTVVIMISSAVNGWIGGMFTYSYKFISVAIIPFLLFSNTLNSINKHKIIMFICIACVLIMIHQGSTQIEAEDGYGWAGVKWVGEKRITYLGTFNDPNDLGLFFVMTLPMIIYLYTVSAFLKKIFWVAILFTILYGIYLTNSRGALLSALLMVYVFGIQIIGLRKMLILGIVALPVLKYVMSSFRKIEQDESANGRIVSWYEGFQMLKEHPFFGVGMDAYTKHNELTAHNSYVLVLGELGVFGFVTWSLFLMLLFVYLINTIKNIKSTLDSTDDSSELRTYITNELSIVYCSFYSMIAFVTGSFFLSRSYSFTLYIFSGIAFSSYLRLIERDPSFNITTNNYILKLIACSLLLIILLNLVVKLLL
ncbi:MAG: O-antigen ligase family protein [Methylococcales bacterium]